MVSFSSVACLTDVLISIGAMDRVPMSESGVHLSGATNLLVLGQGVCRGCKTEPFAHVNNSLAGQSRGNKARQQFAWKPTNDCAMRTITAVIIAGVSLGLTFQGCQQFGQGKAEYFPVKQAVADATSAVSEYRASEEGQKSPMRLKSAKFTFKVVNTVSAEVGVNILILNVSGSVQGQQTTAITYSYKRPSVRTLITPSLKSDLAKAIDQAIRSQVDKMDDLIIDEVTITKEFGVEKKIGVGGQAQFSIVTIGPKVSAGNNTVQSVDLVFEKKS
jgi:hypothetical protein